MDGDETFMDKRVVSGPAEVIDYGTVISFAGNPITLHYKELNISIVFEFRNDDANKGTFVDSSMPEDGTLKLTLYNFDDRFGAGTTKPMRIGKYEGRRLYLQLRVYSLAGTSDKTLQYTIYKVEEVGSE